MGIYSPGNALVVYDMSRQVCDSHVSLKLHCSEGVKIVPCLQHRHRGEPSGGRAKGGFLQRFRVPFLPFPGLRRAHTSEKAWLRVKEWFIVERLVEEREERGRR